MRSRGQREEGVAPSSDFANGAVPPQEMPLTSTLVAGMESAELSLGDEMAAGRRLTKELALQVEFCLPRLFNASRPRGVRDARNGSAGFGRNSGRRASTKYCTPFSKLEMTERRSDRRPPGYRLSAVRRTRPPPPSCASGAVPHGVALHLPAKETRAIACPSSGDEVDGFRRLVKRRRQPTMGD